MAAPDPAPQLFKDSSCTGGGVHTWQHPIQRSSCSKILLAPEGASTHASQRQQQGRWRWHTGARLRLGQQGIPLGFNSFDLFDQELEPIELAADLGLQALRKRATIARDQRLEPLATVSVQGLVVADPLGEQKPLDAIDVPDPFGRQRLALPTDPAPILLLGARSLDHRTNPGLAPLVGQAGANEGFAVDPVRLRPPTPP